MKRRTLLILALAVTALAGGWFYLTSERAQLSVEAVSGTKPEITEARRTLIPTVKIAKPVGWKPGETPTPAEGLKVNLFADGLAHPRWLLTLPNGDVLVAESNAPPRGEAQRGLFQRIQGFFMKRAGAGAPSANRITLLRDTDGDGVAETRSALLTGLNSPFGMALIGDWLYVANTDAVVRVPFKPGETKITAPPEKIVSLPANPPNGHWTRNLIASPDGTKLYVTVGSNSNIADGEGGLAAEEGRAAIWEVDLATRQHRIFAYGLRNPNGLAWEPVTGALWTTVNERDMLGSDLAPDYLTHVEFGGFYGWPWYYWHGYIDKRVPEPEEDMRQYMVRPDYALGPHTASLGLVFANGATLGPRFAAGAFIGQHGSWNRRPPSGYKVVYVAFDGKGRPTGKPIDVLTGFLNNEDQARGRPVGVVLDATGALLVADDVGNRIWRVTGPAPTPADVKPGA